MSYLETMTKVDEVIQSVLALPLNDRSYVTSKLIESLEEGDKLSDQALAEYDQRVERFKSGQSPASTSEELDNKVAEILSR